MIRTYQYNNNNMITSHSYATRGPATIIVSNDGDRRPVMRCPTLLEKRFRLRWPPTETYLFFPGRSRWIIVKDVEVMRLVNTTRATIAFSINMILLLRATRHRGSRYLCTTRTVLFLERFRLRPTIRPAFLRQTRISTHYDR